MNKIIFKYTIIIFFFYNVLLAHCQIPCGIYEDAVRIYEIKEDFNTIKKAMYNIKDLSTKENPISLNQRIRWVNAKEEHATKIQDKISQYFLIQRIKPKKGSESEIYIIQVTLLHKIMVSAMKCKQTLDSKNVTEGLKLLDEFIDSYFDDHGKDHINKIDH